MRPEVVLPDPRHGRAWMCLAPWLLVACIGEVGSGLGPSEIPSPVDEPIAPTMRMDAAAPSSPPPRADAAPARAVPLPWRRLTRAEYSNTLRDLVGDSSRPGDALPFDEARGTFATVIAADQASPVQIEIHAAVAERLAAGLRDVQAVAPCTARAPDDERCARVFVDGFGRRAFRRPVRPDEATRLLALFRRVRDAADYEEGIRALLQAMLQTPQLLYHLETPPPPSSGALAPLDPYDVASRLSYFLWSSMPDDALFAAAASGELATATGVEAHARRMLKDAKAKDTIGEFYRQLLWLSQIESTSKDLKTVGIDGFATLFAIRAAAAAETIAFAYWVHGAGDGKLMTLLASTKAFVLPATAPIYGVPATAGGKIVETPPGQRAGLLTQPSLMWITSHPMRTSPTLRGKFVRDQLLCDPPPPPPPDIDLAFPAENPGRTTRESFELHATNPACAGCHRAMDPLGFAFEALDPIGRLRAVENGVPIDQSTTVVGTPDLDGKVDGAVALARRLAGSAAVRRCVAKQWFRFARGRDPDPAEAPALAAVETAFVRDGDLRELLVGLARSEALRSGVVQ